MTTHHELRASEATVRRGVVDRTDEPVLTIESGDVVSLDTWNAWGNQVTPQTTIADVARMVHDAGDAGPHDLTGPIAMRGARPGDVLAVEVLDLVLRPHAFNLSLPGHLGIGLLAEDFADGQIRHVELTGRSAGTRTTVLPGIEIPVRPFLGYMGVAPAADGPHSSIPPGSHGGNIDVPDLVVGTTLYLPVWTDGALFCAGDAHAAQGYGEVNLTALEASVEEATLRFTLLRGGPALTAPRAETPTEFLTTAFAGSLEEACREATRAMVDVVSTQHGLSRIDAYALCSMALDLKISQVVNAELGVQAGLARELFTDALPWFGPGSGWEPVPDTAP
ncbi:acetamidase/formamidase family protein [Nocardioides sp. LHD-245]|uniref:acetamidase/formamidase family protein n=1 Tax=Nocardioides sp. LHD-245 TaxID=3051387 RepID=UPI0027E0C9AD|nr:acetamidase/formamidase family protein [Nocardioides sp. LHD-245]